ncbi:MAG: nucleotidyltransferase domain-containing protein [Fimbriimonadaceae bacterium]|nr:nucleotidyltransferase domain-containing protein [Fimbriimonadaceae bacterium]
MVNDALDGLGLPSAVSQAVADSVPRLVAEYGPRLAAVLLYGSAVQGGYRPGRSDVNLLLLLDTVRAADLTAAAGHCAARRAVQLRPVLLTLDDLRAVAASTPSIVLDIRGQHRLLHGESPLGKLPCGPNALRAQLRVELRDKLFRLRAAYAGAAPRELVALLDRSYGSLLHLLRNALRLHGRPADSTPLVTLGEVARTLKLDLDTLRRLHALRFEGEVPERSRLPGLFDAWCEVITAALRQLEPASKSSKKAPPAAPTEQLALTPAETSAAVPDAAADVAPEAPAPSTPPAGPAAGPDESPPAAVPDEAPSAAAAAVAEPVAETTPEPAASDQPPPAAPPEPEPAAAAVPAAEVADPPPADAPAEAT